MRTRPTPLRIAIPPQADQHRSEKFQPRFVMETHRRGLVLLFIMFTLAAFAESPFKFVLLTSTTRFDDAATGTADEQRTSYQYDDHGRVVFRAAEWDFNGDGALDYRS